MDEMIACCGLACHTCPIHLATGETDAESQLEMRTEIARLCNEKYGLDYGPQDLGDCDGCRSGGRLFVACGSCAIRECVLDKGLANCAGCDRYACDKLEVVFADEPAARARLDDLRCSPR